MTDYSQTETHHSYLLGHISSRLVFENATFDLVLPFSSAPLLHTMPAVTSGKILVTGASGVCSMDPLSYPSAERDFGIILLSTLAHG